MGYAIFHQPQSRSVSPKFSLSPQPHCCIHLGQPVGKMGLPRWLGKGPRLRHNIHSHTLPSNTAATTRSEYLFPHSQKRSNTTTPSSPHSPLHPSLEPKSKPPSQKNQVWLSSSKVERYAKMDITQVTLEDLLKLGERHDLLSSARFAHQELPKRMARRVKG